MSKAKDSSSEAKAKDVKIFFKAKETDYFKANFKDNPKSALRLLTK